MKNEIGIVETANSFDDYFPAKEYRYDQYAMKLSPQIAKNLKASYGATKGSDGTKLVNSIRLERRINLINFIQSPYSDSQIQRFEAATRKNWAIKSANSVKEFFIFGKGSELIVELPESETEGLLEEEKEKLLETRLNEDDGKIAKIKKKIMLRDEHLNLVASLPIFWWQLVTFGRGAIIKLFDKEADFNAEDFDTESQENITRLLPINTRRLADPILDTENDMAFEGLIVDGQPLDKSALIYGTYQPVQISPHTEWFGYSTIEPIVHLAEGLNIFWEEDAKEIQRSAWAASILLQINTAGLTVAQARSRIKSIIGELKAAKYIGVNQMGIEVTQLKLDGGNLSGLVELAEKQEAKIFKALHVPQFLVQSEDIANRATADKAASLFLNGPISKDQKQLSDILWSQWYEPFLRQELKLDDNDPVPFTIKRIFKQAKVSEFIDLAQGVNQLVTAGIWDIEKANEILESEEVTKRVSEEKKDALKNQPDPQNEIKQPKTDQPVTNQVKAPIKN